MVRRLAAALIVGLVPFAAASADTIGDWRVIQVSSKRLPEVSGCVFSRRVAGKIWVHNDSGSRAVVVPIDLQSGKVGKPVELKGVDLDDAEDIAITSSGEIFLADIGDNAGRRRSVQLYRFEEPGPKDKSVKATRVDLRYPDGPHNAEAFVVAADGSSALIFTKSRSGIAGVYEAKLGDEPAPVMTKVGEITIGGEFGIAPNQITAADLVGTTVVMRTYQFGYALDVPPQGKLSDAAKSSPKRFSAPFMIQAEALCLSPDGRTVVTASESRGASTFSLATGPSPLK
jgi:hypothetical protein